MGSELEAAFVSLRPALLRHCYRMLGSLAEAEDLVSETFERAWKVRGDFRGIAPVERWLYAIATNSCINAVARRRRRELPQLESHPTQNPSALGEMERERWISPAPDSCLFQDPSEQVEQRETVALAFIALLQRLPPRQRAVLVLRDVLGWSAEETSGALSLSVASVNSALLRARAGVAMERAAADEPPKETVEAFVRAWEIRDLDSLVGLLRAEVTLAMPPYPAWFRGLDAVVEFFRAGRFQAFWATLTHVEATRANGRPAFAFLREVAGSTAPHSIMVASFRAGQVSEMTVFIGASYFKGFKLSRESTAQFRGPGLS